MIQTSIVILEEIFEKLKTSYYEEKTKNQELHFEISQMKLQKQQHIAQIEELHDQIRVMVENELQKLNLSKNYEDISAQNQKLLSELQIEQQSSYEKDLLSKRQIYMLESENQEQRITIEKYKQAISQMESDVEGMFRKLTKTGYGELVSCNQTLLNRIANLDDQISEYKILNENLKQTHNEEISRQAFNYGILVQQYQTLLKENQNLIKSQSNSTNLFQSTAQKFNFEMESKSLNNSLAGATMFQSSTVKKKKY